MPATDLFVLARHRDYNVPRCVADANLFVEQGCNCSISTNNVLNPFTPFGDCSLIRMANLHANILQVGQNERLAELFAMVTHRLPGMFGHRDLIVDVGGLMSYGADINDLNRRAALYIDKILKGAKTSRPARGTGVQIPTGRRPQVRSRTDFRFRE